MEGLRSMRTLSSTTALCLIITTALLVGCVEDVDPNDASLLSWDADNSEGLADMGDSTEAKGPDDNPQIPGIPGNDDPAAPRQDIDGDGITADLDCNDYNYQLGAQLFADSFDTDTGSFQPPPRLRTEPWIYGDATLSATGGGQQAVIGREMNFRDLVITTVVSADGTNSGCLGTYGSETNTWRAGLLARANLDRSNNGDFNGYRCALGSDDDGRGGAERFLQIIRFNDVPERGDVPECGDGPADSYTELTRAPVSTSDLAAGSTAVLSFALHGDQMECQLVTTRGVVTVSARADDDTSGSVGFSTLNMYGKFHYVTACGIN